MRTLTSTLVVAAALAVATPAAAQTPQGPRSDRPYRGLFAGDTGNARQLLTLSASFGGGYDDDIFASDGTVTSNRPLTGGSTSFLSGSAQIGYSVSRSRMSFSASFGSGTGYYPGLSQPTLVHHSAGAGVTLQVARRASLTINQSEAYQPFFFYSLVPINVPPIAPLPTFDPATMTLADAVQATSLNMQQPIAADAVAAQNADYYLASETNVSYSQGLAQRLTMHLGYDYRRSDSHSGIQEFKSRSASGGLAYALGKGVSLNAGYGHSENTYPLPGGAIQRYAGNTIDSGIDYNKALSFSRRTALSFSTGMSGVSDGNQLHYAVTGSVHLTRELGRSWSSGVSYNRNVSFVETFRAPVLSDSVSASVGGLISRKLQFNSGLGISRGRVGYTANNDYQTTFVSAGVRYALTRYLSLNGNYSYYRYSIDDGVLLAPGIVRHQNRQSFGFSVEAWVPLIQRNRSANATR